MNRDVKMDVQLDVPMEGYAGRIEIVAGPTGLRRQPDAEKGRIAAECLARGLSLPISRGARGPRAGRYMIGVAGLDAAFCLPHRKMSPHLHSFRGML
jgi:hypothetical protein